MNDAKMPLEHYRSLATLEDHYWWHQTRYLVIWDALRRNSAQLADAALADVGCGTGGFLRFLRGRGMRHLIGCDYSDAAFELLARAAIPAVRIDLEKAFTLPGGPYDVLAALDVMEHLADEAPFLRSARANLRAQGLLALTVPAHPFLFSEWDRRLKHFRRYSKPAIRGALERAGFRVLEVSHFFSFAMPIALARRWTGAYDGSTACEFPAVSVTLNRLLLRLGRIERRVLERVPLPFGTSLHALAQPVD